MTRIEVIAAVFALTLPFGIYRSFTRRLSWQWLLAIHLPIPFVFLVRYEAGLSWSFLPFSCAAFAAAQFAGAWLGRRIAVRRDAARQREEAGETTDPPAPPIQQA
jgi:hypothetical protein